MGKLKEETEMSQDSHAKIVSEEKARLEAREKSLTTAEKAAAAGRDAFVSLELRSRTVLQTLYGEGYEEPLATSEEGLAEMLPKAHLRCSRASSPEWASWWRGRAARFLPWP